MASIYFVVNDLDIVFAEFYCSVIPSIYDMKNHQFIRKITTSLKNIRQLKKGLDNMDDKYFFALVQYREPTVRCAYMYAYSVIHSKMVHFHFSCFLKNNVSVISPYLTDNKLTLCCLGGGPGIEAVAISKVIHDLVLKSSSETELPFLNVYITVVDICSAWKTEVLAVVDAANRNQSLFDVKRIKLHAKFIQADLLKPFESDLKEEIKEANVVTLIKLANSVDETASCGIIGKLKHLVANVVECMDKGSCLFLLDSAGGTVFTHLARSLPKHQISINSEGLLHEKHCLGVKILQKMEMLLSLEKKSIVTIPTRLTTVSSRFWVKAEVKIRRGKEKVKGNKTSSVNELEVDVHPMIQIPSSSESTGFKDPEERDAQIPPNAISKKQRKKLQKEMAKIESSCAPIGAIKKEEENLQTPLKAITKKQQKKLRKEMSEIASSNESSFTNSEEKV